MIGSRTFGTKKQSVANKRATAMQYLVLAREPSLDTLLRNFGLRPNEAQQMLSDEMKRRANGAGSTDLMGMFGG